MFNLKKTVSGLAIAAAMAGVIAAGSARADNIVNEWASVKPPPAPALKPVAVETKTTALLMLDFMNSNCGARPRCVRSVPVVKTLLFAARAAGVPVIYSIVANTTTADIIKDLAPVAGEPWVQASVDKFVRTDLEKILQERGVRTVIVVGTAAHGAVFYTGSAAAMRGLNVVVPVDGVSADPYLEQATVWLLANGTGGIGPRVTLTQIDQIKF